MSRHARCYLVSEILGNPERLDVMLHHLVRLPADRQSWPTGSPPTEVTVVVTGHWLNPNMQPADELTEREREVAGRLAGWAEAHPERFIVLFGGAEYARWRVLREPVLDRLLRVSRAVYVWHGRWVCSFGTLRKRWLCGMLSRAAGECTDLPRRADSLLNALWRQQTGDDRRDSPSAPGAEHKEDDGSRAAYAWHSRESPLFNPVGPLSPTVWSDEDRAFVASVFARGATGPVGFVMAVSSTPVITSLHADGWLPVHRRNHFGFWQWYDVPLMGEARRGRETPVITVPFRYRHSKEYCNTSGEGDRVLPGFQLLYLHDEKRTSSGLWLPNKPKIVLM